MSIKRIETQLARLDAKIQACQAELAELKAKRSDVKARLTQAKKAVKLGQALPAAEESEGLVERIGAVLTENVIEPIAGFMSPAPPKVESGAGSASVPVA